MFTSYVNYSFTGSTAVTGQSGGNPFVIAGCATYGTNISGSGGLPGGEGVVSAEYPFFTRTAGWTATDNGVVPATTFFIGRYTVYSQATTDQFKIYISNGCFSRIDPVNFTVTNYGTTTQGFTSATSTSPLNYYKTTEKTNFYTTLPTIISGECTTTSTQLIGDGVKENISDNFTTEKPAIGTITQTPVVYGEASYYHAQDDSVMFTGVAAGTTKTKISRFSEVYSLLSPARTSQTLDTNKIYAVGAYQTEYSELLGVGAGIVRPIIAGSWVDDDLSTTGKYWAGFGNNIEYNATPYKTLTSSSAGETWGAYNVFKTSVFVGNPIEDEGPLIVRTGCDSWTQDGTTSWISGSESSTQTTVQATYSSSVSTETAEGQPTTSTRSDKYVTYSIGLDSAVPYSDITTTENPIIEQQKVAVVAPVDKSFYSFGRQNNYTSKQTLYLASNQFLSITKQDGGISSIETSAISTTNGTSLATQDFGFGFTLEETHSYFTSEVDQGLAMSIIAEPAYNYTQSDYHVDPVYRTNSNLGA